MKSFRGASFLVVVIGWLLCIEGVAEWTGRPMVVWPLGAGVFILATGLLLVWAAVSEQKL